MRKKICRCRSNQKLCTYIASSSHPCVPLIHPSRTHPINHLPLSQLPLPRPNRILLPVPSRLPLPHYAHRPPLHHQTHHLEQRVRRRHRRVLGVGVVRRRHLDNVGRDKVDAFQPADDRAQLARRPTACFGRAGCGGDCCRRCQFGLGREGRVCVCVRVCIGMSEGRERGEGGRTCWV